MRQLSKKTIVNWVLALLVGASCYYMGQHEADFEPNELQAIGQFQFAAIIICVIYNCQTKGSILAWALLAAMVNMEGVQDILKENYKPTKEDTIAPLLTIAIGIYSYFKWRTTKKNL